MTLVRPLLTGILVALALLGPNMLAAQLMRQQVVVSPPAGMPRVASGMAAEAQARKLMFEAIISEKMSPQLMQMRGDEIRAAFEPADALLRHFTIVSREELDGTRSRVTCEADVDLGAILLRLVTARVLTFGTEAPKILLVPGANTSLTGVQAIRARLIATLGLTGLQFLAVENVASGFVAKTVSTPLSIASIVRNVSETKADLIVIVTLSGQPAPSTAGGVILDASLQFTVVRPRDNGIVVEQAFTSRGSGATRVLAEQSVIDELGSMMAQSLGSQLATAVFANGDVVDPSGALAHVVTVDVFFRPTGSATAALIDALRQRKLAVRMGSSSLAAMTTEIRNRVGDAGFAGKKLTPSDRLIIEGRQSVSELFDLLASTKFGPADAYSVSTIEYGDDYLGIEIIDGRGTPHAPKVIEAPTVKRPDAKDVSSPGAAVSRPPLQLHKRIA